MARRPSFALALLLAAVAACDPAGWAPDRSWTRGPTTRGETSSYPLDGLDRAAPAATAVACPTVPLVDYRGTLVRFDRATRVHPAFAERLRAFEQVVVDTAVEVYGRAPAGLRHAGTFSCRRVRHSTSLLSEHAFGNGIDVVSFRFAALPRGSTAPPELPTKLRRAFTVSLAHDWDPAFASSPSPSLHARFLDALARRLVERRDIFRVLLGPAHPDHRGHFHFDCAPWRHVAIWTRWDTWWPLGWRGAGDV